MGRIDLEWMWNEVRGMSLGTTVDRLDSPPTPLHFMREYVSQNKPCLISNAISHWPALSRWPTPSYLPDALSSSLVSLNLTPDGRAYAVVPNPSRPSSSPCFAEPHVKPTPFPKALDLVRHPPPRLVAYLQPQLQLSDYPQLASDFDAHIPWASEALGCRPETVDFWVENSLSKSSFRRYQYENLYAVVSGEMHLLLIPPMEAHRMYIEEYKIAEYSYSEESEKKFMLKVTDTRTFSPSVDPYPARENREREMAKFPLYFDGPKPFKVTVKAGQMFYLPAMWFHHVRRVEGEGGYTISVNYWYEMAYDFRYACFNFLELLPFRSTPESSSDSDSSTSRTFPYCLCGGGSSYQSTANNVEVKHPKQKKRKKNWEQDSDDDSPSMWFHHVRQTEEGRMHYCCKLQA